MNKHMKTIVVAGDTTLDWNIARMQLTNRPTYIWNRDNLARGFCQRGGAAMLAEILEAVAPLHEQSGFPDFAVIKPSTSDSPAGPDETRCHHTYSLWRPYDADTREKGGRKVWRVSEFLGIRRATVEPAESGGIKAAPGGPRRPDLIILDDADLGFRERSESWPRELHGKTAAPWILLKMAPALAAGKLWDQLKRNHPERVIVLVNADDVRQLPGVSVSRRISWERTAQDLVWEFQYNPRLSGFRTFAHTVVSFGTSGAVLVSRAADGRLEVTLFFDPAVMEEDWNRNYPGGLVGYTSCLAAAIAREIICNADKPDLHRGIQTGVSAMRLLHTEGYGHAGADLELNPVAFPVNSIAENIARGGSCLAAVSVSGPAQETATVAAGTAPGPGKRPWTILETRSLDSLERISRQIVREGLEAALPGVPVARFSKLVTVDRKEIEALNCVGGLLREYYQQSRSTPISIAVFGAPGSGKSFAVKQVADWIRPGEFDSLTFNMSQLAGPADLIDAFHQVRDKALSGKIPLVFWDEFDTTVNGQPLGWLRYFLAPMQDGEFQEGQIIHPIGRSIFVFAGGTSYSMDSFSSKLQDARFRDSKLPDFISRLRGFLNILGPNCQAGSTAEDPFYIVRRAILLRSLLERNAPQLLHRNRGKAFVDIDDGVLRALLLTREYEHGARSMEGIILASQLTGNTRFGRSDLPTQAQLDLHTDGREFYSLVHTMDLDAEALEKVAEAAHNVFCDHLRAQGYEYGPVTLENERKHSSLKPYHELSGEEKEQNRNNVRDISNKLAAIGYAMVPLRSNDVPGELGAEDVRRLAKMEHERWMREKVEAGWKYSPETDKSRSLHRSLVPWEDLPAEEQEKDYVLVKGIPEILAQAGYMIIRLG